METITILDEGTGVRIFGPAKIALLEGEASILGVTLVPGKTLEIPRTRSYYIHAATQSKLRILLTGGGRIEKPRPGEEPLPEWLGKIDQTLEQCPDPCRIIVLGPVDSGKTSMTALIANRAFAAGLRPYIIDSDIGQADIGPPGFVSGSIPEEPVIWLRQLSAEKMVFVGHVEPAHVQAQLIHALTRLLARAKEKNANVLVVDTDGWIEGWHALEYKMQMLRTIDPHVVVVMGDEKLASFVQHRWHGKTLYLKSPQVAAERSRSDRIELRKQNYKRFLEGSVSRELSIERTPIINACLPITETEKGRPVNIYEYPGGVCAFFNKNDQPSPGEVKGIVAKHREAMIVYKGGFHGVLVGLTDMEGWDHPGVIEEVDLEKKIIRIRTPYLGPVKMIVAGRIRLTRDYHDTGARRIWI